MRELANVENSERQQGTGARVLEPASRLPDAESRSLRKGSYAPPRTTPLQANRIGCPANRVILIIKPIKPIGEPTPRTSSMLRSTLILLSCLLCAAAHGQTTQPTPDRVFVLRSAGDWTEFVPEDANFIPFNLPVFGIGFDRNGDGTYTGRWVPKGTTRPTTPPADPGTVPIPQPSTVPVVIGPPSPLPAGIHVKPGESWASAVRSAKPGDTVWLASGGEWSEPLTDIDLRLERVTIAAYGSGPAPVIRVSGTALVLYRARDVSISGVRFESDKPTGSGVRLFGCERVSLTECTTTGFTFGVTVEAYGKNRNSDITFTRHTFANNYNPKGDSSGIFASATDRLTFDACAVTNNGWQEGGHKGSPRDHGIYTAGDCTFVRYTACRFERNSSHGLQARSGGIVEDCVFLNNPIGLSYGLVNGGGPIVAGGVTGSIRNNTFIGTRLLAGSPRGWAIEMANVKDAEIVGNTFAGDHTYDPKREIVAAIKLDVARLSEGHPQAKDLVRIGRLRIDGNRSTWPGGLVWLGTKADALSVQDVVPAVDVAAARKAVE